MKVVKRLFVPKNVWLLAGIFDIAFFDLVSKWLAERYLTTPLVFFKGYLTLHVSYNPGIAFSIPIPNVAMILATPILIFAITYLLVKTCNLNHLATKFALIFMIGGALGNFINRIWNGAVTDFIDFSFFPSFNLADAYLTVGAFLIIVFYGKIAVNTDGTRSATT